MRVVHVVTLASPDGVFGGPTRVAVNQVATLHARGHDAVVTAGQRGYVGRIPTELEGAPAQLFPVRRLVPGVGLSGLVAPGMWRWLQRTLPHVDVVHIHLGRDLVTLPAARMAQRQRVPYIVQTHGMIAASESPLSGPLDALLTRPALTGASAVLYLNDKEREGIRAVAPTGLALHELGNGVPVADDVPSLPPRQEVLFCSRLHARKRPVLFVDMARRLLAEGVDASFVLVGPDDGEGEAVAAGVAMVGDPEKLRWEGPLDPADTLARIKRASVFVLPSVDEPWAMAVIEALSVGRPVVVTSSCGVSAIVREHGCGLVVDESPEALVDGVRAMLADRAGLADMAGRATSVAREHFSMDAVADRLERLYAAAASTERSRH